LAFGGITAGTAWIDVLPNMAKFAAAMGTGLAKQGKNITKAGKSLTRHITLPVLAAGAASIKLAADFDRVFEQMVGLAGVTRREVGGLKEFVLDLAPVVGKAPEELAKALYFLRSSGLAGKAALDALVVSAKLSTAGLGETEVVADAVSSAINAYGAANITAAQAGDVLAATVREGKGEADAIAPVLGSLLPLAARLGVGFDQVGGAIASMTRIGESAPRAATALRGLFTSLLNVSPKVTKELKKVGLSQQGLVRDLANPKKGLPVVLTQLEKAFGGNIFAIRKAFPNIRGLSGLLALTGKNGKATQKVMEAVNKSVGSTEEAFAAVTEGEGHQFEKLMATLRVAGIRLGNVLLPFVTQIAEKITEWIEAFQKLDPRIQKFIGIAVLLAATLGPLLVVLGTVITAIAAIAAVGVVGSIILAVVAGVVILAAAFVFLYKKSERFRAMVGFIRDHLQILLYVFGLVPVVIATVVRYIIEHFGEIKGAVSDMLDGVRDAFFKVKDAISDAVKGVVGAVTGAWNEVKSVTVAVFGAIIGFFQKWWPLLLVVFALPLAVLFAIVNRSWRRVLAITRAVFGLVKTVVSTAWNAVVAVISAVVSRVVGVVRARFNAAKAVVSSVMGAISGVVSRVWNAIANAIGGPLGRMVTTVQNKFNAAKNWLMGFVGTVYGIALDIGSAIVDGIVGGLGGLLEAAKDKIVGGLQGALDAAKGFLGIDSPSKLFKDEVGKPVAQGIIAGASEVDYSNELGRAIAGAAQTRSTGALGRAVEARREMSLRITNWREGTGYFEEISDEVVAAHAGHGRQVNRMRRG
jgi:TP901 family phage tail tape measure protein